MSKKQALLLVNLGTPEQPTKSAVRAFLRDFLSDKRVVDVSRLIWLPILYLVILPIRSKRVAKLYKSVWMDKGSPLRVYTESITEKLATKLADKDVSVHYAMTYGKPSIKEQLNRLQQEGVKQLTVLPLYPQYSVTTTAPVFDQLSAAIKNSYDFPALNFIHNYHDHPLYIELLAKSISHSWLENGRGQCLIFSFHGIPKRYVTLGDVYQAHCEKTVALVAEKLHLSEQQYRICYQSRVGREEWLKPYLDESLPELVKQGVQSVDVISPAFACDCLETLEELAMENRDLFIESGGKHYNYIPCANDSDAQINLLANLAQR